MNMRQMITGASRITNGVGVSFLAVMMLLTTVDVIGRYFFSRPITGAYELTEFMMVIVVFLGLAYTAIKKGHAAIEVAAERFPVKVRAFFNTVTTLLSLAVFIVMAWQGLVQANLLRTKGETSALLFIPVFPFFWVLAFGCFLLCLVLLLDIRDTLSEIMTKKRLGVSAGVVTAIIFLLFLFAFPIWGREMVEVSPPTAGLFGVLILIALFFVGMPVGFAMAIMGLLGMIYVSGVDVGIVPLRLGPYSNVSSYAMSVIPLFVLMGLFAFYSGLAKDLFFTAYKWLGRLWGGLAMATVAACAALAAVSGSSLATAATMGTVTLPEMKRYKYSDALATGVAAAGGTLGSLIPPSVMLIIYAILTDESIGTLFMAGIIPGLLEALFYMVTIYVMCKRLPHMGPRGPKTSFQEKVIALKDGWQVLVLFIVVMGGIYSGIFTPTEAGAIGAFGAFFFALLKKQINKDRMRNSLLEAGKMTAMIFIILVGAIIFGYFLAVTRLPYYLAGWVAGLAVNRYVIISLIILVYIMLGCFMSSIGMVVLTVPIFFPLVLAMDFHPIWFGIIIVRVTELAQITPPYGINCFIVKGVADNVSIMTVYKGVVPFIAADILHIILLVAFPQLSLFLPSLMK